MNSRSIFLLFVILGLTSCGGGREPAPVVNYGQSSGAGSAGAHAVSKGDTLYSISNRYRLSMRDIATVNNLQPPFKLYEGQRLKMPPPQEYKVQSGDTLYGVSHTFGVNSNQIARLNDIRPPYALRIGQMLRLPSVTRKTAPSKAVKTSVASVKREALGAPSKKPAQTTKQAPVKTAQAQIKDGVPIPSDKPAAYVKPKSVKVSKVTTRPAKRSSSKFLKPVRGKVISKYGAKKSGLHNDGINIAAARGTAVKAAENGVVVYAGSALKGSGNLILVRHDGQWMTAYAHLDHIGVKEGQRVTRGRSIGRVGSTGSVSTPQLHFEVRRGTSAMNPLKYLE